MDTGTLDASGYDTGLIGFNTPFSGTIYSVASCTVHESAYLELVDDTL